MIDKVRAGWKVSKSFKIGTRLKILVCIHIKLRPTVTYGCESGATSKNDVAKLKIWKKKILRRIFGKKIKAMVGRGEQIRKSEGSVGKQYSSEICQRLND